MIKTLRFKKQTLVSEKNLGEGDLYFNFEFTFIHLEDVNF